MRFWLSTQEIADLALDGMPASRYGVQKQADREDWQASELCRPRQGREGGGGLEYHIDLLPLHARLQYLGSYVRIEQSDLITQTDLSISANARTARDARIVLLRVADRYRQTNGLGALGSDHLFCQLFDAGQIPAPEWVLKAVKRISTRTLARWRSHQRNDINELASDPSKARKGTGVLDKAEDGRVRAYCLAIYASNQFVSTKHIRNAVLQEFGPTVLIDGTRGQKRVAMPPLRTFQNALKSWKETHRNELLKLTDPDAYKSKVRFVASRANRMDRLNQKWEIDASPSDVMTTDGRRNIYAAIDLYSRRVIILVTDTPRAASVGLLIRKCLTEWGIPEIIKTDNGSDFTAQATVRLLDALGIEQELSTPYSPEQKGTVERVIGTFQRDCAATLPGFIGHSVADRKVIEARKAFSARIGTDDAKMFNVELSAYDLQTEADRWANEQYAHTPHEGLKRETPFNVAAAWDGPITKIEDPRALDVLLAPVSGKNGIRRVTAQGIRIDGEYYLTPAVMPDTDVFCRHDPNDLGRLWLFEADGETYLGEAVCPHLAGLDPVIVHQQTRAAQKARETAGLADIRKEKRLITPRTIADAQRAAYRHNAEVVAFPKKTESHETPALAAALDAKRKPSPRPLSEAQQKVMDELTAIAPTSKAKGKIARLPKSETPEARFAQAKRLEARIREGEKLTETDATWLAHYQAGPEYQALSIIENDRRRREVTPAS